MLPPTKLEPESLRDLIQKNTVQKSSQRKIQILVNQQVDPVVPVMYQVFFDLKILYTSEERSETSHYENH